MFFSDAQNGLEGLITPFLTRKSKNFETPDFMDIYGHLWTFMDIWTVQMSINVRRETFGRAQMSINVRPMDMGIGPTPMVRTSPKFF